MLGESTVNPVEIQHHNNLIMDKNHLQAVVIMTMYHFNQTIREKD
jgi:beta-glucosidase/6-phospho-beta-glucosidase/beta-galactosidase